MTSRSTTSRSGLALRLLLAAGGSLLCLLAHAGPPAVPPDPFPAGVESDFVLNDFRFADGEAMPRLRLHYRTFGTPRRDAQGRVRNAVLLLHGTGGSGTQFLRPEFSGELFVPGGVLDARRYYLILPDGIGHGRSARPSEGMHAHFPHYTYADMVEAQYRLLTEGLKVDHLRLVLGTSMGGMHAWIWGERHADFMDALMPLACLPAQISGRNRIWRRLIIDAIQHDPAWAGGEYTRQPPSLATAAEMLMFMASSAQIRQQKLPTIAQADAAIDETIRQAGEDLDANDLLYQFDASRDYDPGPALESIRARLLAINTADDLINPPELGILEREIRRVPRGSFVLLKAGPETRGHGSHTVARLWKAYLEQFLEEDAGR